jgi:hypothetical protein
MLFQVLDDKSECVGIYCKGNLYFDEKDFPSELTQTWKYSSSLRDVEGIEYANLYLEGMSMEEAIPEYLKDDWEDIKKQLRSFTRSLKISKVNMTDHCIYDLTPTRFLKEYGEIRNQMTSHIIKTHPRPERYEYLLRVNKLLTSIAEYPMKISRKRLNSLGTTAPEKGSLSRLKETSPFIRYNQFGTRTGRLTTEKESFPILTMRRDHRVVIEPHNSAFVELDFNGAEARTVLGLAGLPQPAGDVHEFHANHIFENKLSRDQVKTAFFAWLYGSRSMTSQQQNDKLSSFYNRQLITDQYWDGSRVTTPYKKVIEEVDGHHALNYIIQSTTAELTLLQALKIDYYLRVNKCQTRVACLIHDAIILDFCSEDNRHLPSLRNLMGSTTFGNYAINISRGSNLGSMKKVNI